MKITKKSEPEIEMEELLKECEIIIDDSYIKTKEARKILDAGYKLLQAFKIIRESRDNWRNRYEVERNNNKTISNLNKESSE